MQTTKPKGLAKIWRAIKRPFKQGLEWKNRRVMSREEYKRHLWRKNIIIGKDGKVQVPFVLFFLANGCNLKCEFCTTFSPFRAGIVPKEVLIDSFAKWSHKISPETITLIGGEPLLNADITKIITAAHHYMPQSRCQIYTNAILLPHIPEDVLHVFEKYDVHVNISQHLDTQEYRNILEQSINRLKTFRVQYNIVSSFQEWEIARGVDANGVPIPFHSNPVIAYKKCREIY